MIVALTGTPGTGKTSVASELDQEYRVIDLTEFVKERGLGEEKEEFEVDVSQMVEALEKEVDENTVVEGHLAHHLPTDYCIVLRCKPEVLEERLQQRDYNPEKIQDNVESEALDVVLQEAVETQEKIIEIDTTDREPQEVAREIEERIEKDDTGYGGIDWSDFL